MFLWQLVGESSDVDVFLETQHLQMDTTFTSLRSQKYVKLTNRSDITARFEWKTFETQHEVRYRFLVSCCTLHSGIVQVE